MYGFMNEPVGDGPFPVVLVLHGYVNPSTYNTLTYTTRYADSLARAGFLVIHPNFRNHPPSDSGPNSFRVGYAIDVENLAAIVRETAGAEGPLRRADGEHTAVFGHSMGGAVALRVITIDPEIDAAVLYGSMSGDERLNYERYGRRRGAPELETSEQDLLRISPINHIDRIEAAIAVHHGESDNDVPPSWSTELCDKLEQLGKPVDCYFYPGQGHLLSGEADAQFLQRVTDFLEDVFSTS
jgi:dipeptidyl aminopeptidase/acylaminoacyl peptidase